MGTTNRIDSSTAIVLLLVALVALPLLWMGTMGLGGMMGYGGMMYGDHVGSNWWVLGAFVQLLFLLLVLGGGYVVVRRLTRRGGSSDPALDELRRAYARGDLSDEEFENRRERLER